jgi:hypothetical protein
MDKPIAWYDPSNGMVSTDKDSPLFTPLGQVWGLYPKQEWVGLTQEEIENSYVPNYQEQTRAIEAKLKEKNT